MEAFAIAFLFIFVLWLFSKPHGGGHRPPKGGYAIPTKPPPKPSDAGRSARPR